MRSLLLYFIIIIVFIMFWSPTKEQPDNLISSHIFCNFLISFFFSLNDVITKEGLLFCGI